MLRPNQDRRSFLAAELDKACSLLIPFPGVCHRCSEVTQDNNGACGRCSSCPSSLPRGSVRYTVRTRPPGTSYSCIPSKRCCRGWGLAVFALYTTVRTTVKCTALSLPSELPLVIPAGVVKASNPGSVRHVHRCPWEHLSALLQRSYLFTAPHPSRGVVAGLSRDQLGICW